MTIDCANCNSNVMVDAQNYNLNGNLIRPIYLDSGAFKDKNGIYRANQILMANRNTGIFFHTHIHPHPDVELPFYLKDLSLDKCFKAAPTIEQVNCLISQLVKNEEIICWNKNYEIEKFPALKNAKKITCLMKETTNYFGIYRQEFNNYKYPSLEEVARLLNIKFGIEGFSSSFNKPHRVLPDVKMTMDIHERYLNRNIRCPVLPSPKISLGESPW